MVKIEGRVAGGHEEITAGVATEREVTTTMDTDIGCAGDALELHLEVGNVLRRDDGVQDGRAVREHAVDLRRQVALEAARIVGVGAGGVREDNTAGVVEGDRAEVDRQVLEGTRSHAAASRAGGQVNRREASADAEDQVRLVGDGNTIARQGGGATIKDGRVLETSDGGEAPVPVRLGSLVAALLLESPLVDPGVVPVPHEEVARVVDGHGLVDVGGDEVIEAGLRAGNKRTRGQGRLGLQALDGRDVRLLLVRRQGAPRNEPRSAFGSRRWR